MIFIFVLLDIWWGHLGQDHRKTKIDYRLLGALVVQQISGKQQWKAVGENFDTSRDQSKRITIVFGICFTIEQRSGEAGKTRHCGNVDVFLLLLISISFTYSHATNSQWNEMNRNVYAFSVRRSTSQCDACDTRTFVHQLFGCLSICECIGRNF